ncbi:hypothetical protein DPMN_074138 [Dreissena polymorpha]|uniref:Uncharacterized protein n=1 Tax=Dreissena polymorpha TaxID=45954 RepID=A0A9D4BKD0_DREPO|nr:hypothetical protein DPMN_074138 [Dreissena polymorpha]
MGIHLFFILSLAWEVGGFFLNTGRWRQEMSDITRNGLQGISTDQGMNMKMNPRRQATL